jgi:hypothetical protein
MAQTIGGFQSPSPQHFGARGDGVTDDTASVIAAVAHCYSNNIGPLEWPDGEYLTTATIPHFHDIKHVGSGVVKRDVDSFYITQGNSDTNTLYVADATGHIDNDGLSVDQPILTTQKAIDVLTNWGPYLNGVWVVQLTDEEFRSIRFPEEGLRSAQPIQIKGIDVSGHPNVPITQITNGPGAVAVGIQFWNRTDITVSDILFIGFNGSTSSAGVYGSSYCNAALVNCHFEDCTWAARAHNMSVLDVKGGIVDACGYMPDGVTLYPTAGGFQVLFGSKMAIGTQGAGVLTNGPIIRNSNIGVYAQEASTGHIDWTTIDNCIFGVRMSVLARANVDGTAVTNCAVAFFAADNGVISPNQDTLNNLGTGADSNTNVFTSNTGGTIGGSASILLTGHSTRTHEVCILRDMPDQVINSTGQTIFASITLAANVFVASHTSLNGMKSVRARCWGTLTGANNTKSVVFRFGVTPANCTFVASDTGNFMAEGIVLIGDDPFGTQSLIAVGRANLLANRIQIAAPTEAMTSTTDFSIAGVVVNAADSITINGYEIFIDGL